jgi:hypothetical protein
MDRNGMDLFGTLYGPMPRNGKYGTNIACHKMCGIFY